MIAPVTAVIVALGVYPQLVLERTEEATYAGAAGRVAPSARWPRSAERGRARGRAAAVPPGGAQQITPRSSSSLPEEAP